MADRDPAADFAAARCPGPGVAELHAGDLAPGSRTLCRR